MATTKKKRTSTKKTASKTTKKSTDQPAAQDDTATKPAAGKKASTKTKKGKDPSKAPWALPQPRSRRLDDPTKQVWEPSASGPVIHADGRGEVVVQMPFKDLAGACYVDVRTESPYGFQRPLSYKSCFGVVSKIPIVGLPGEIMLYAPKAEFVTQDKKTRLRIPFAPGDQKAKTGFMIIDGQHRYHGGCWALALMAKGLMQSFGPLRVTVRFLFGEWSLKDLAERFVLANTSAVKLGSEDLWAAREHAGMLTDGQKNASDCFERLRNTGLFNVKDPAKLRRVFGEGAKGWFTPPRTAAHSRLLHPIRRDALIAAFETTAEVIDDPEDLNHPHLVKAVCKALPVVTERLLAVHDVVDVTPEDFADAFTALRGWSTVNRLGEKPRQGDMLEAVLEDLRTSARGNAGDDDDDDDDSVPDDVSESDVAEDSDDAFAAADDDFLHEDPEFPSFDDMDELVDVNVAVGEMLSLDD